MSERTMIACALHGEVEKASASLRERQIPATMNNIADEVLDRVRQQPRETRPLIEQWLIRRAIADIVDDFFAGKEPR